MRIIDFTDLPQRKKMYSGANGGKIAVVWNDKVHMLKFPAHAKMNDSMSYANSCFSEYIGCHIYESIGIPAQKTTLGVYRKDGQEKIVVACEDFTKPNLTLQDFASLKNNVVDSLTGGANTELSAVCTTIDEQTAFDPEVLRRWFWDMFVVDALIGNWDRHNGNWGFLYNAYTDDLTFAPIFDCGSSLYPQADEAIMRSVLTDEEGVKFRVYEIPTSALKQGGKKIRYFDFITSLQNEECNKAILRIVPRIDLARIKQVIDEAPLMSDLQRAFYFKMLAARKEMILDIAYTMLTK